LGDVKKLKEEYNLEKIVGVLLPKNIGSLMKIKEEHRYIYPGLYVFVEDFDEELLRKARGFEFIKVQNWLGITLSHERIGELLDKSISIGIKKFQIHTEKISKNELSMLEKYVKESDAIFYLTHGIYAIYSYFSNLDRRKLRKLEGNLLLGTSPHFGIVAEIPNYKLSRAISDGLENMIVFESDFTLQHLDALRNSYKSTIQSVTESIGENEKVLYENLKVFLK